MHYEIDEMVGFDPVTGQLWVLNASNNRSTLPRFASQLLEILIIENEKSLSREHLLDTIWHNNGLSASGNNLNNYISIIRRALSSLGLNNIIITIPKYGFSFHASRIVKIEAPQPSNNEEIKDTEKFENTLKNQKPISSRDSGKGFMVKMTWISIFSCLFILVVLVLYAYFIYYSHLPKSALGKFKGKYENCNIYAIWNGQHDFYTTDMISAEIKDLINNENLSCKSESDIYIYKEGKTKSIPFLSQRVVISHCPDTPLSRCRNIHRDIINHN
ncbi:transcriptional regulator [Erwinia sp. AnSW2-5]|uniref:winged helix-turn-helix domain-containing protein n=1 Tax=Erwinia sp. AnSW2-5 TaxID=3367692 RepID=UPI00385C17C1